MTVPEANFLLKSAQDRLKNTLTKKKTNKQPQTKNPKQTDPSKKTK